MQEHKSAYQLTEQPTTTVDTQPGEEITDVQSDLEETSEEQDSNSGRYGHFILRETVQVIAPALILALVVHLFLAQATVVFGQSMEPNLSQHQRLIVDKVAYRLHPPQRDDIVVLDLPEMNEMLVKRIVGLPGEVVEIRKGVVYVDNNPVPESYAYDHSEYDMEPILLGPLNYFVLGDNRSNSNDSRVFGPVHRDHVLGHVWLRYWPLDQMRFF
jgi:signal peptidase I